MMDSGRMTWDQLPDLTDVDRGLLRDEMARFAMSAAGRALRHVVEIAFANEYDVSRTQGAAGQDTRLAHGRLDVLELLMREHFGLDLDNA